MNNYEGMAFIKCFTDMACNGEVEMNDDCNFTIPKNIVTNNNINPYIYNIWLKNVGDHTAYDINISIVGERSDARITYKPTQLVPKQVGRIRVEIDVAEGSTDIVPLQLSMQYSNI